MYLQHSTSEDRVLPILREGLVPPGFNRVEFGFSLGSSHLLYFTAVDGFDTKPVNGSFHFFLDDGYVRRNAASFAECSDWDKNTPGFMEFVERYGIPSDHESNIFHPNMVVFDGSIPLEGIERLVVPEKSSILPEIRRNLPKNIDLGLY